MAVITLIGVGPRGLTILDRIIERYRANPPTCPIEIHLVDPGEPGQGVHCHGQPQHLLINTIGGMVTMFPGEPIAGAPPRVIGPSFPEWARMAGYRRFPSGYFPTGPGGGVEISDHDYLPRYMLGRYLTWYFDQITAALPAGVRLVHHRCRARDLQPSSEQKSYKVELENGNQFTSDFVFIATGHGANQPDTKDLAIEAFVDACSPLNSHLKFIRNPYPIERLVTISPQAVVAVQGLGLTAHDVIAELTAGRGGRFVPSQIGLKYLATGREPRIVIFSRNCLPFTARGVHQKVAGRLHQARFFTKDAVARMRENLLAEGGNGQLDFDRDLLPLIIKEMAYVFRSTQAGSPPDPERYEVEDQDLAAIESILYPLKDKNFGSLEDFREFFLSYLRKDLEDAELGNVHGPAKAAVEVIRDSRQALRLAVEYGGLTPSSHRRFVEHHVPIMNRITFGPPRQRNYELLALFEAGIIDLASGPRPIVRTDPVYGTFVIESSFDGHQVATAADVLITAHVDVLHPERSGSPFFRNLVSRGLLRPFCNASYSPGGVDVDHRNHPISRAGVPLPRLWVVGYPVEGPHFFTHALPLPLLPSRHVADADKCVLELFADLDGGTAETRATPTVHGDAVPLVDS